MSRLGESGKLTTFKLNVPIFDAQERQWRENLSASHKSVLLIHINAVIHQ